MEKKFGAINCGTKVGPVTVRARVRNLSRLQVGHRGVNNRELCERPPLALSVSEIPIYPLCTISRDVEEAQNRTDMLIVLIR